MRAEPQGESLHRPLLRWRAGGDGGGVPVLQAPGGLAAGRRRAKEDWARDVAALAEGRYAGCQRSTLVLDNLNTHGRGAFCRACEPERARRIECRSTPQHGSWLNSAESELSAMTRQCLRGRRSGDSATLRAGTAAWSSNVNGRERGGDWRAKIDAPR